MILVFLIGLISFSTFAADLSGDVGVVNTNSLKYGNIYLRPYGNLSVDNKFSSFETKASVRAFSDIAEDYDQDRIEVRELYAQKQTDSWTHKIGAQFFSFSETFGVQILDIANPRDYTDFIINDLSWSKLPVWSMNSVYTQNEISVQMIFTPYAGKDILPVKGSFFDISSDMGLSYSRDVGRREIVKDSEYGARVGYLFANGLDLNVLAYRHFNRTPTLILENLKLNPYYDQVTSLGASFSYVLDDFVFRGDTLFTENDVYSKNFELRRGNRLQYIYGLDYTFSERWTVGYQLQYRDLPSLHWNSFFIQHAFNDFWQFDVFSFIGLNNDDVWYQPKVTYKWRDAFVSLQYDVITATSKRPGIFTPYQNKDRILTNIGYKF